MTLRLHYQERLEEIRSRVVRMGGYANEMVRLAVEAVITGDSRIAAEVISADDQVDALERDTLQYTVLTIMQEAPVADDMRMLLATVGLLSEIEQVGDDAVKLARRATKLTGHFPPELKVALQELGDQARRAFSTSLRLYTDYNNDEALELIRSDKEIDGNYSKARNRVFALIQANPQDTENLVRTIEAFHALEHVADHATKIAVRLRMLYAPFEASNSELS